MNTNPFEQLLTINNRLDLRFPDGNHTPYQIMTRLLEECGELAEQVHIFEDSGIKRKKHGVPDKTKLAKEIQDIMRCALQVAAYYDAVAAVEASIAHSYQRLPAPSDSSPD